MSYNSLFFSSDPLYQNKFNQLNAYRKNQILSAITDNHAVYSEIMPISEFSKVFLDVFFLTEALDQFCLAQKKANVTNCVKHILIIGEDHLNLFSSSITIYLMNSLKDKYSLFFEGLEWSVNERKSISPLLTGDLIQFSSLFPAVALDKESKHFASDTSIEVLQEHEVNSREQRELAWCQLILQSNYSAVVLGADHLNSVAKKLKIAAPNHRITKISTTKSLKQFYRPPCLSDTTQKIITKHFSCLPERPGSLGPQAKFLLDVFDKAYQFKFSTPDARCGLESIKLD